jgi:L-asparaginase II
LSDATKSAGFTTKEIALMCASHNGEEIHVQTAKSMANKLGFDESHYECGNHAPYDKMSSKKARHTGYTAFHNNCSGKHSGMLAIAKKLGQNPKNYTSKNHPVQRVIFDQIAKLTGSEENSLGIDGCSAPTPFLSLIQIGKLFQLLVAKKYCELTTTYDAMIEYPYLVAGKNRFDTDFIEALNGRGITKVGGEAIRGAVIKTEQYGPIGIAQKVLDGNQRANEPAIMKICNHLNLLMPNEKKKLDKYITKKLFNHRQIHIGNIEAVLI